MSTDKWATSTSTQLSTKVWVKLLLLENALKLNFWGPRTNWKFEPSPRPHTHSDPITNEHAHRRGQKATYGYIMVCTDLPATG